MKNLIAGLREYANSSLAPMYMDQAATAIEKLEAENAQLKSDLTKAQMHIKHIGNDALRDENERLKAELAARIGWKLAPLEPTDAMLQVDVETDAFIGIDDARKLYSAMIAAAPGAK